ncbi:hypothetical protein F5B20DRAFT_289120 [Whalleya microplaca]|nr:hypothetical protein F5B20DRAFT_289120 [Whalleya microplaca]
MGLLTLTITLILSGNILLRGWLQPVCLSPVSPIYQARKRGDVKLLVRRQPTYVTFQSIRTYFHSFRLTERRNAIRRKHTLSISYFPKLRLLNQG